MQEGTLRGCSFGVCVFFGEKKKKAWPGYRGEKALRQAFKNLEYWAGGVA